MPAQRSRSSVSTLAEAEGPNGGDFLRKAGQLYQKTSLRLSWRPRYFSLEGTVLYCYRREGDATPKSFLVLTDCRVAATTDKKLSSFRVSDPKTSRILDLAATTPSVAEGWLAVLTEAIDKMRVTAKSPLATEDLAKPQNYQERDDSLSDGSTPAEGFPAVPELYSGRIEATIARIDAEMNDEAAWSLAWEKNGVRAHTKVDGSLTAARGTGFVPFPPRAILELVTDVSRRTLIDPFLELGQQLQALDAQTSIDYYRFIRLFLVAKRDFCNLTHWRVLPDGAILVVAQGIEDEILCPSNEPNIVRAHVHLVCVKIVPNEAYDGADVSFMVKADLKGRIPARVAAKAASDQPLMLVRIKEVLQKSKDLQKLAVRGRVTNTLSEGPTRPKKRTVSFTSTPSRRTSTDSNGLVYRPKTRTRPTSLQKLQPSVFEQSTAVDLSGSQRSTVSSVLVLAIQLGCVGSVLTTADLPVEMQSMAVTLLVLLFTLQSLLGSVLTLPQPKKVTLVTLQLDLSNTKSLVEEQRQEAHIQLTVAHVLVRALSEALMENSTALGSTCASCLMVVDDDKEVQVCGVSDLAQMSLRAVCDRVPGDATELHVVKNAGAFSWTGVASVLCAGTACGIGAASWMMKKPCVYESCVQIVAVLAVLSLTLASASLRSQAPLLVNIGPIVDKAIVVDGKVEVRPVLTLAATIDHRCVGNFEAEQVFRGFKQYVETAERLQPVANAC